jgi:hypothetical protein
MRTAAILGLVCISCFGAGVALRLAGAPGQEAGPRAIPGPSNEMPEQVLTIRWQRLQDSAGQTCDRCGITEQTIEQAGQLLAVCLKPLGFRVAVEKSTLTPAQFALDPSQSNRIWIGDQPLETVLGAKTGTSQCAGVCGEKSCRAMVVNGRSYEAIPVELIVRAGMKVAADMIEPNPPAGSKSAVPCCGSSAQGTRPSSQASGSAPKPCCEK